MGRNLRHSHATLLGLLAVYREPADIQDTVQNDKSDKLIRYKQVWVNLLYTSIEQIRHDKDSVSVPLGGMNRGLPEADVRD
jgi:hypothetical protein